jgi:hypothetical protein
MTKHLQVRLAVVRRLLRVRLAVGVLAMLAMHAPGVRAEQAGPVAAPEMPAASAAPPSSATAPATAPAPAPATAPPTAAPAPPTIVDLPVDESTYENTENCISMREIRNHIVLDDRHIVFELRRGRYVLSQFKQRCEYLRQQDTIALHAVGGGSRLCALDQVSVLESNMHVGRAVGGFDNIGGFMVIGRCFLGPFEEITKEQLGGLRDAVRARQGDDDGLWDWITGD